MPAPKAGWRPGACKGCRGICRREGERTRRKWTLPPRGKGSSKALSPLLRPTLRGRGASVQGLRARGPRIPATSLL